MQGGHKPSICKKTQYLQSAIRRGVPVMENSIRIYYRVDHYQSDSRDVLVMFIDYFMIFSPPSLNP